MSDRSDALGGDRLAQLLAHVGCGSLDEHGKCKLCDEIRVSLGASYHLTAKDYCPACMRSYAPPAALRAAGEPREEELFAWWAAGEALPPDDVDVRLLAWAVSNCHILARRRLRALDRDCQDHDALAVTEKGFWGHVQRICEKAGARTQGILRASVPTELTEGAAGELPPQETSCVNAPTDGLTRSATRLSSAATSSASSSAVLTDDSPTSESKRAAGDAGGWHASRAEKRLNELAADPRLRAGGWNDGHEVGLTDAAIAAARQFLHYDWDAVPTSDGGIQLERHHSGLDIEVVIGPDGKTEEVWATLASPAVQP